MDSSNFKNNESLKNLQNKSIDESKSIESSPSQKSNIYCTDNYKLNSMFYYVFGSLTKNYYLTYKDELGSFWLDADIKNSNLSTMSKTLLSKINVKTFQELLKLNSQELFNLKIFNRKNFDEIVQFIQENFFLINKNSNVRIINYVFGLNKIDEPVNVDLYNQEKTNFNKISDNKNSLSYYIYQEIPENYCLVYKDALGNLWEDASIKYSSVSIRLKNVLARKKIKTFQEVLKINVNDLLRFRNLDEKCFKEIIKFIEKNFFLVNKNQNIQIKKYDTENDELIENKNFTYTLIKKQRDSYFFGPSKSYPNSFLLIKINELEIEDYELSRLPFSARIKKSLNNEKIVKISDLLNLSTKKLQSIRNLGNKCINEIFNWLNENSRIVSYVNNEKFTNLTKIINNLEWKKLKFNPLSLSLIIYEFIENNELEFTSDLFPKLFYLSIKFKKWFEDYIIFILEISGFKSFEDLLDIIIPNLTSGNMLLHSINNLIAKNKITKISNYYYSKNSLFSSFLKNLKIPDTEKEIINLRITKNCTLEEIGSKFNLTRERVRQKVENFLKNYKNCFFLEDCFSKIFQKYNFNKISFLKIFGLGEDSFYYLKNRYKLGTKDLIEIKNDLDDSVPKWVLENIEIYNRENEFFFDGKYVKKTKHNLLNYFIVKNAINEIHFDNFFKEYSSFILEKKLEFKKFSFSKRNLENKIARSENILWKTGKKFRYFEIKKINLSEFFQNLNLINFNNKEISTKLLFDINRDLMSEFDIRDEYELHNLIKKTFIGAKKIVKIELGRIPIISIGNSNRNQQVIDLLYQESPITRENLSKKYEDIYGVKKESVSANFFHCIDEYFDSNSSSFIVRKEELTDYELEIFSEKLKFKLYTFDSVKKVFLEIFPFKNLSFLNSYNLKKIGFNISKNIVYKNNGSNNLDKFIRNYLDEQDTIDFNSNLLEIYNHRSFNSVLFSLKKNFEIFEFEKYKYISLKKIQKIGFSKNDFLDYIEKVASFVKGNFFTIYWLEQKGFNHRINELGFDNFFYENIIKFSNQIKYKKINNLFIFKNTNNDIDLEEFIYSEIKIGQTNFQKINIYDLIDNIQKEYDIKLEKQKVISYCKNYLYYDKVTENIYINFECYLKGIKYHE